MFVFNSCSSGNHGNVEPMISNFPDHSFLHFPSPFDDEDSSLLLQQYDILLHHLPSNDHPAPSTIVNNLGSESTRIVITDDHHHQQHNQQLQILQRIKKASSKRDRHSKIDTLRGPRDRRMRLSLPVAREFFGLQDVLGLDKASKTVEWLLFQARHAIKKLIINSRDDDCDGDSTSTPSSLISDGEVVSGIDETTTVVVNNDIAGRKATRKEIKRSGRVARKTAAFHPMAREYRAEARARARARTREKQQLQIRENNNANPIEQIKQDLTSKISTQGIITDDNQVDDCLMNMGKWNPSNSIYNNGSNSQEHPFGDLQFFGKSWDPYNNHGNMLTTQFN